MEMLSHFYGIGGMAISSLLYHLGWLASIRKNHSMKPAGKKMFDLQGFYAFFSASIYKHMVSDPVVH
jgi:hypothetical protein